MVDIVIGEGNQMGDEELDSLARQYTTPGTGFYSGPDWNNIFISICECGVPSYEDMSDESLLKLIKKICDIYLKEIIE
jgi:hypothetical protein